MINLYICGLCKWYYKSVLSRIGRHAVIHKVYIKKWYNAKYMQNGTGKIYALSEKAYENEHYN
jgi:hypothetical protein